MASSVYLGHRQADAGSLADRGADRCLTESLDREAHARTRFPSGSTCETASRGSQSGSGQLLPGGSVPIATVQTSGTSPKRFVRRCGGRWLDRLDGRFSQPWDDATHAADCNGVALLNIATSCSEWLAGNCRIERGSVRWRSCEFGQCIRTTCSSSDAAGPDGARPPCAGRAALQPI
jgi:hypothetical protein